MTEPEVPIGERELERIGDYVRGNLRSWLGEVAPPTVSVPQLVERYMEGELQVDPFITHTFQGVEATNDAFDALHSGDCLRAVVVY